VCSSGTAADPRATQSTDTVATAVATATAAAAENMFGGGEGGKVGRLVGYIVVRFSFFFAGV